MPGVILILMGLLLGAISGVFRRLPNQRITSGEVVSLERDPNPEQGRTRYAAWVEYQVDGAVYTVKSRTRSSNFYTGQRVQVAYDPAAPQNAVIRPGKTVYLIMAAFFLAGAAVIALSVLK